MKAPLYYNIDSQVAASSDKHTCASVATVFAPVDSIIESTSLEVQNAKVRINIDHAVHM